jgi:hypothetical protein
LRLLDSEDHLRLVEDVLGRRQDLRALGFVMGVLDRRALPRALLDIDVVAVLVQLTNADRRDRDPVLVGLDLGGDAYLLLSHQLPCS